MIRYVYVEQFGGWWRFAYPDWIAMVRHCMADECGYDLDRETGGRRLRGRPSTIGSDRYQDGGRAYFAKTNDVLVKQPLDWGFEEFAEELRDIEQRDAVAETVS
jgi:hypothetical protein